MKELPTQAQLGEIHKVGAINFVCTKSGNPPRWAVHTPAAEPHNQMGDDIAALQQQMLALKNAVTI
jgi:hypothetical protein